MDFFTILDHTIGIKDMFLIVKNKYYEIKKNKDLENTIDNFDKNLKDIYENYSNNLKIVFDKENLEKIKQSLKDESAYDLESILKNFINKECMIYDIPETEAKEISDIFFNIILEEIRISYRDLYNQLILGKKISIIDGKIDQLLWAKFKTIKDIEHDLLRSSRNEEGLKDLTLEFFNYEDHEFSDFMKNILDKKNEVVYIDGPSREEVFYNVLYFFKHEKYLDENVLIIETFDDWEKISKDNNIKDKILIPNFYNRDIKPILYNKNIFIYGEEEKLNQDNKITLHRRLRRNLEKNLKDIGYDYNKINEIFRETNGVYSWVKRKIFSGRFNSPKWTNFLSDDNKINIIKKAILLGKWKTKDKKEIEKRFDVKYDEFITKLRPVIKIDEPLIIEHHNSYFLACPEEAWAFIKDYLSEEEFIKFSEITIDIIGEIESEYVENYNREYSIYYASKYKYSETLKEGLLRSLILFDPGKNKEIVRKIFNKIFDIPNLSADIKWSYISRYILNLCEISPKAVLQKLDEELSGGGDLITIFEKGQEYNFLKPNYYTQFIWTIEILLQVEETAAKALNLLFKLNELTIDYKLSNRPSSTLKHVFCVWKRDVKIPIDQIFELVEIFIKKYNSGWDVIKKEIPYGHDFIVGELTKPKYLNYLKNTDEITIEDYNYLAKKYIELCLKYANSVDRLKSLTNIHFVELTLKFNIFDSFREKLEKQILELEDKDRKIIQDELRNIIYQNRFYHRKIDDKTLEEICKSIKFDNPAEGYRYLFNYNLHRFPLLNPINISDKDYRNKNLEMIKSFITEEFFKFKNQGYSYLELLKLEINNPQLLGEYIFNVYSNEEIDENILEELLKVSNENQAYKGYIDGTYKKFKEEGLKKLLELRGQLKIDDEIMVDILLLERLNLEKNSPPLIEAYNDLKEKYWKKFNNSLETNSGTYRYVIKNLFEYKNQHILTELDWRKEWFSEEELLNYLTGIKNTYESGTYILDSYSLESILEKIYLKYSTEFDKYFEIAEVELYFRNVIDITNLKCFLYLLKKEPNYYSEILKIIFKKKDGEKYIESGANQKFIEDLLNFYLKLKFCPCTHEGNDIGLENLIIWKDKFKNLLKQQQQEYLFAGQLGKIFANSPKGNDGFYPHESIIEIIEKFSGKELENLQESYEAEIVNQRGVYIPDDGKTEMSLSQSYKKIANALKYSSPNTAEIYQKLSDRYKRDSVNERERAIYVNS